MASAPLGKKTTGNGVEWKVLPGSADWQSAERSIRATLRRRYPMADSVLDDTVASALPQRASRGWNGDAPFATYATTIARHLAARESRRIAFESSLPVLEVAISESDRGAEPRAKTKRDSRLDRVLVQLVESQTQEIETIMFQGRDRIPSVVQRSLSVFLPQMLKRAGIDATVDLCFSPNFNAEVLAYAARILSIGDSVDRNGNATRSWGRIRRDHEYEDRAAGSAR